MTRNFFQPKAAVAMLGLALMTSFSLQALPASADLVRRAYVTLSLADHDYKGHRVAAMKQVAEAANILQINLRGDGRGREKQGVSDEQLRTARGMLEQARPGLKGKALRHVERALDQINIALRIR